MITFENLLCAKDGLVALHTISLNLYNDTLKLRITGLLYRTEDIEFCP